MIEKRVIKKSDLLKIDVATEIVERLLMVFSSP